MSSLARNSVLVVALAVAAWVVATAAGCASIGGEEDVGDPQALEQEADAFHTNLRWERYEHAYDAVHDAYRSTFEGRFEERGDDYEIVEIDMVGAEVVDEGSAATVEVEQQWYELPSTVVESERFVERWVYDAESGWRLRERLQQDVYRERGETFDSERGGGDDQPDQGGEPTGR